MTRDDARIVDSLRRCSSRSIDVGNLHGMKTTRGRPAGSDLENDALSWRRALMSVLHEHEPPDKQVNCSPS